jgi:hypothetical protein
LNRNTTRQKKNINLSTLVPNDASETVRKFVESLFITHAETKLNTFGQLLQNNEETDDDNNSDRCTISPEARIINDRGEWCRNIVFGRQ